MASANSYDPLLFGHAGTEGLVAVEHLEHRERGDEMLLFLRRGDRLEQERQPFRPFLVAEHAALAGCPEKAEVVRLGGGRRLDAQAFFPTWKAFQRARRWVADSTRSPAAAAEAPYLALTDPVHQHLLTTGLTHFLGLPFESLRRVQVDIECFTTPGYEFCNAEREGDRIIAIALARPDGEVEVLSGAKQGEKELLEAFVAAIRRLDPDVIEGHNLFNFDLPYLAARARRHRVKLALGRDGSEPARRPSRLSVGERTLAYERFDVFGRHVVDTLHLVQFYDITHRSLEGFGLKEVAVHFGLAAPDRTYLEGGRISRQFEEDPDVVMRYVRDDAAETRAVASLLSRSSFLQARMVPYAYQNVCVRGTATKIDALLTREYLRHGDSLPMPDAPRAFEGGYTDIFVQGLVKNVHHVDVRSLYPSLMLTHGLAPRADDRGVFLALLRRLRDDRLEAKRGMQHSRDRADALYYDALQSTLKVLINSFYGYLGFAQARFGDFGAAEEVTARGRELLKAMIAWLGKHGGKPVEIDTDGIYFVPPAGLGAPELAAFRKRFTAALPEGIDVEFDGEYRSMYSYKMKNYALLAEDGEVVIKGAALKSRGLEPFQREFLRRLLRLKLEEREADMAALKEEFAQAIRRRAWPVERLAKTEMLQDSPAAYQAKRGKGRSARRAAYELALASGREYRAGDHVSYYVTGERKTVSVHDNAKLVSDADPARRDENVAYYLAKLDALYDKFSGKPEDDTPELGLEERE